MSLVYVIDSSVFIQAHRSRYPLDVAIGFWVKLKELAHAGLLVSIDKVKGELFGKNDDLEMWCGENLPSSFFRKTDDYLREYRNVIGWANERSLQYNEKALADFMQAHSADAFLVAYCLNEIKARVLVTQESGAPKSKSIIKIPDCCQSLGVEHKNTIAMFRALKETF